MRTINQLQDMSGRTVIITGGNGYIGQAFAEALSEVGANIALVDLHNSKMEISANTLSKTYSNKVKYYTYDLSKTNELYKIAETVYSDFGDISVLINAAGFVQTDGLKGWTVPFEEQTAEAWNQALAVNLTAPFFLTQACAKYLKKSGHGSVINITSLYSFLGPDMSIYKGTTMGNAGGYAASKGGLLQITRWLATVLSPDIRVNCVSPGGVWRNQPDSFVKAFEKKTPLGRMQREEDLKGVIVYLASDMSEYVTGQHIPVEGGWSAW